MQLPLPLQKLFCLHLVIKVTLTWLPVPFRELSIDIKPGVKCQFTDHYRSAPSTLEATRSTQRSTRINGARFQLWASHVA